MNNETKLVEHFEIPKNDKDMGERKNYESNKKTG